MGLAEFEVTPANFDVLQMVDVPDPGLAGNITFTCSGAGVAVATVLSRWNVDEDEEPAFYVVAQQWVTIEISLSGGRRLQAGGSGTPAKMMQVKACAEVNTTTSADADLSVLDGYHIFRL